MWPSQFLCRLLIIPISDLFSSTILSISSLVLCSIQLITQMIRQLKFLTGIRFITTTSVSIATSTQNYLLLSMRTISHSSHPRYTQ